MSKKINIDPKTEMNNQNVAVIHPEFFSYESKPEKIGQISFKRQPQACLEEAIGLVQVLGLSIIDSWCQTIPHPRPATLFGRGVVDSVAERVAQEKWGLVVINTNLTPIQQRNLERAWLCKVIDRTGLILEIFGERAQTAEGRMQVELAALTFQRSRLVRSWTHLERQRGGFGFIGGPGESQIELDRRLIDARIDRLRRNLKNVVRTRGLHRHARTRVPYPIIALVGYTNAGKSSLFNFLAGSNVSARDQLFATLDPTMRAITLPNGGKAILSDTVGFISDLPTQLVAAFRATLEEVRGADLLLHVRDAAHPDHMIQSYDVDQVLTELEIDPVNHPIIQVYNKIDQLDSSAQAALQQQADEMRDLYPVSALTGEGCAGLLAAIATRLGQNQVSLQVSVTLSEGATLAFLYRRGEIIARHDEELQTYLTVRLSPADIERAFRLPGLRMSPKSETSLV